MVIFFFFRGGGGRVPTLKKLTLHCLIVTPKCAFEHIHMEFAHLTNSELLLLLLLFILNHTLQFRIPKTSGGKKVWPVPIF